jgi:hypothetical protein
MHISLADGPPSQAVDIRRLPTPNLISQVEELPQPLRRSMVVPWSVGHFTDKLSLPRDRDLTVAGQSCHRALVSEVLAPSLELFYRSTVSFREDR